MGYIIYGKRVKEIIDRKTGEPIPPDKRFAAIDADGNRVSRLANAKVYDTKEEAKNVINTKASTRNNVDVLFEIRKV